MRNQPQQSALCPKERDLHRASGREGINPNKRAILPFDACVLLRFPLFVHNGLLLWRFANLMVYWLTVLRIL
jgi:hypothetical protein